MPPDANHDVTDSSIVTELAKPNRRVERRRENILAVVVIAMMIMFLVGYALYQGVDGVIFASGVGALTFCAGLILPNPFTRRNSGG